MRSTAIELVDRRACPVCGTPTEQIVLDLAYEVPPISDYLERFYGGALDPVRLRGERYRLASCASCTLTYQVGVPDEAFLAELYDEVLAADPEEVRSGRGLAVRQGYAHQVEQFLVHFGRPPDEVQVLDFGAGQSPWLDMAAAWGCATTAIELSAAKATTASDAGHEVVTLGEIAPDRYDFINTEQVFEHLSDPLGTARALAGALAPGGLLRISVPSGRGIDERISRGDWEAPKGAIGSLNPVAPLEHLNCYQHRSLEVLAARVGLAPFHYPVRGQLGPMARIRPVLGAALHAVRPPRGNMVLFRRE